MKDKKLMTPKDKWKYFWYKVKTNIFDYFAFAFFAFFGIMWIFGLIILPLFNITKITKALLLPAIIMYILSFIIFFICRRAFKVLFFKNNYIIDGHIHKQYFFRNPGNKSNGTYKAKAISDIDTIATDWIPYPFSYRKKGKAKVKIVIRNNKAVDFYM